ncbi:chemotaxis protein CheA [Planosporangium thailandense]|uniref:histidine kinase n=1 Tax=Planosporangium thailandense TaxID=765197 RepID=A0ABX0Y099_9ACTN|nr:chemotaxis protein CheW [Planosporangium thailandense]NJC71760.1 chemotaxis protein CheA [Planosporangium thailandense]
MDELGDIVQEFLVESHENLDQLDRDLVALEQQPGSRELLSSIFRTIHTIKGTSGFLAFNRLERVTHVGENLLARLRDGTQVMTPETTDTLLRMVDVVRTLLAAIEETGAEGEVDVEGVIAAVTSCIDSGDGAGAKAVAAPGGPASPTAASPAAASAGAAATAPAAGPAITEPPAAVVGAAVVGAAVVGAGAAPEAGAETTPEASAGGPAAIEAVAQASSVEVSPLEAVAEPAPDAPVATAPAGSVDDEHGPGQARRSIADSSIRVDVDLLDKLMNLVGELVLTRNQMLRAVNASSDATLARTGQRLNLITSELQEGVMKTRMQAIDHLWSKLPRVVRDLSSSVGKQVRLAMEGRETELDRSLLEAVKDPLTHLVRNAVDHGIEAPADRVAAGKAAEGVLTLRAYHEGGHVIVEVADDGKGMDPDRIAAVAVKRGLLTRDQVAHMERREILNLVFKPGFSTADKVTNVSGRGVGMDVVKTNIERIGGAVDVESTQGEGTTWRLTIPLTLAIIQALTVECGTERYAIPQVAVHELVYLDGQNGRVIEHAMGAQVYRLRGKLLPLVRLDETLGLPARSGDRDVYVAVLQADGRRFGLVVDRVLNTEEVVVKALSSRFKEIGMYAGATLLGDGRVALILDVPALARRAHLNVGAVERAQAEIDAQTRGAGDAVDRLLIAGVGDRRVAIPLDMVTRLEEFPLERFERVGAREVVQYRDQILPVLRLAQLLGVYSAAEDEATSVPVVVYTERGRSVALAVDRIVDIVEDVVDAKRDFGDDGLMGSAVIQQRVTELLDVRRAIMAADPRFDADADTDAGYDIEQTMMVGA